MKRIYVYSMYAKRSGRRGLETIHAANALWVDDVPSAFDTAQRYALAQAQQYFPLRDGWEGHDASLTDITDDFLQQAGWVRR